MNRYIVIMANEQTNIFQFVGQNGSYHHYDYAKSSTFHGSSKPIFLEVNTASKR